MGIFDKYFKDAKATTLPKSSVENLSTGIPPYINVLRDEIIRREDADMMYGRFPTRTVYQTGDGMTVIENAVSTKDVREIMGWKERQDDAHNLIGEARVIYVELETIATHIINQSAHITSGKVEISTEAYRVATEITQQQMNLLNASDANIQGELSHARYVIQMGKSFLRGQNIKPEGEFTLAVRTETGVLNELEDMNKPPCPDHHLDMKYDAHKSIWRCPEPGCKKAAKPKGMQLQDPGGKVLDGGIELVVMGMGDEHSGEIPIADRNIYLRIKKHNALVPLAEFLVRGGVEIRNDGMSATIELRGLPMVVVKEEL